MKKQTNKHPEEVVDRLIQPDDRKKEYYSGYGLIAEELERALKIKLDDADYPIKKYLDKM